MSKIIGPYIKSKNTTAKMMLNVFIALIPIIGFAVYKYVFLPYQAGKIEFIEVFYPLLFILSPALVSFVVETLYAIIFLKIRNKGILRYIKTSYGFFPGLFLGLILPINIPIWIVLLGAFIAALSKMLLGGVGKNIFNPTLIGYVFILICFFSYFQANTIYPNQLEIDGLGLDTPLRNTINIEGIGDYDSLVTPYGGFNNFFTGMIPGPIGTTNIVLCLVAFIYLIITRTIKWKISIIYLLTVFFGTCFIGNINGLGMWYPLFHILSGSVVFAAIFIATDPVTTPTTSQGQILYGLFLGILTIGIRYLTPISDGVFVSILIMNIFTKILDNIGYKAKFDFRVSLVPYLIAWTLIIGLGYYIGNNYVKIARENDKNFQIVYKETIGNKTTYITTQKANNGIIKGEIIINNDKVISYKILSQQEPDYYHIITNNYLDTLVNNQYNLNKISIINEAPNTSKTLKQMLKNVLKDYAKTDVSLEPEIKKDFEVLSVTEDDNKIVYLVNKKGFNSYIQLRITFQHDIVTEITVIDQNETDFQLIIDANYITTLISKQQNLENVELLKEAEINSNALKDALKLTIEQYQLRNNENLEEAMYE